jgi:ubiquinone/menaquinone biosynthesis C-methylase UbiE
MEQQFIKKFWDNQAILHKTSHNASWGDSHAIELEIDTISGFLNEGDNVLDVGCGNGYSTIRQLCKNPNHITGIDFSESMIDFANEQKRALSIEKIDFHVGDIRQIQFENETFDVTYTTRVLINLPNWEEQIKGIEECLRVTKQGGKIVLSEAFFEPLVLLNSIRALKNLPPLEEHDFNRYLKKTKLEGYLLENNRKFKSIEFSSVYYLGSRFLRELITNPDDFPGYSNPINEIFFDIEKKYSGGGFGIQIAYVIQK